MLENTQIPSLEKVGIALDIDETLSWTIGYRVTEMQKRFGNPENLSAEEIADKYRYAQNVPYWQTQEAFDWINENIHSNQLQKELPVIKGAQEYVQKINEITPIAAYITIRPHAVFEGTETRLEEHGFPKAPIIMKPNDLPKEEGSKRKAEILKKLYPQVLGIIDDNDSLLNYIGNDYPGTIFLYDHTTEEEKNYQTKNLFACKTWQLAYEKVRECFDK